MLYLCVFVGFENSDGKCEVMHYLRHFHCFIMRPLSRPTPDFTWQLAFHILFATFRSCHYVAIHFSSSLCHVLLCGFTWHLISFLCLAMQLISSLRGKYHPALEMPCSSQQLAWHSPSFLLFAMCSSVLLHGNSHLQLPLPCVRSRFYMVLVLFPRSCHVTPRPNTWHPETSAVFATYSAGHEHGDHSQSTSLPCSSMHPNMATILIPRLRHVLAALLTWQSQKNKQHAMQGLTSTSLQYSKRPLHQTEYPCFQSSQ